MKKEKRKKHEREDRIIHIKRTNLKSASTVITRTGALGKTNHSRHCLRPEERTFFR